MPVSFSVKRLYALFVLLFTASLLAASGLMGGEDVWGTGEPADVASSREACHARSTSIIFCICSSVPIVIRKNWSIRGLLK